MLDIDGVVVRVADEVNEADGDGELVDDGEDVSVPDDVGVSVGVCEAVPVGVDDEDREGEPVLELVPEGDAPHERVVVGDADVVIEVVPETVAVGVGVDVALEVGVSVAVPVIVPEREPVSDAVGVAVSEIDGVPLGVMDPVVPKERGDVGEALTDGVRLGLWEPESLPVGDDVPVSVPVLVTDCVGEPVGDDDGVVDADPLYEAPDGSADCVTPVCVGDDVDVIDSVAEEESVPEGVGVAVFSDDGVPVVEPVPVPDELEVGVPVGVKDGLAPPESVPLGVLVIEAVAEDVGDTEVLVVTEDVTDSVFVEDDVDVAVEEGVKVGVSDELGLPDSETVGEIDALAPGVTGGVGVTEFDAGRVGVAVPEIVDVLVDVTVAVPDGVTELDGVYVFESDPDGEELSDTDGVPLGVIELLMQRERVPVNEAV